MLRGHNINRVYFSNDGFWRLLPTAYLLSRHLASPSLNIMSARYRHIHFRSSTHIRLLLIPGMLPQILEKLLNIKIGPLFLNLNLAISVVIHFLQLPLNLIDFTLLSFYLFFLRENLVQLLLMRYKVSHDHNFVIH